MAAWPTLEQVSGQLGVTNPSAAQTVVLTAAVAAAIEQVKIDVAGSVDTFAETDYYPGGPTDSMSAAALILAVMIAKAPDAPYGVAAVFDLGGMRVAAEHPTYQRLLVGQRKAFAIG